MKTKKKAKIHARHHAAPIHKRPMQEISKVPSRSNRRSKSFTDTEIALPERNFTVEIDNPHPVQEGSGPLNQEGEGNRQNDEQAEIEEIKPDLEEK